MRRLVLSYLFLASMCNLGLADDTNRAVIALQCPTARDKLAALNNQLHRDAENLIHAKSHDVIVKECDLLAKYQISLRENIDDWRLCKKQGASHIEEIIADISLIGGKADKVEAVFCH